MADALMRRLFGICCGNCSLQPIVALLYLLHRSRDHSIAYMPFPIGSPLEPSLYL